jgi:hypothetical protein
MTVSRETIEVNSRRIAAALQMHVPPPPPPREIAKGFNRALNDAVQGKDPELLDTLRGLRGGIRSEARRHYWTGLLLLERLWKLTPGTEAAAAVVTVLQEALLECKDALRGELLDRQRSSFPRVRALAMEVRKVEPVDAGEVDLLADPYGFPDARMSVADRILNRRQAEYLDPLLAYLVRCLQGRGADEAERRHAEGLCLRLKELGLEVVLQPLLKAYVDHFGEFDVSGRLMQALSKLGGPLVYTLHELHAETFRQGQPQVRRPLVRLLRQMMEFGNVQAACTLTDLVLNATGNDLDYGAEQLTLAARRLVGPGTGYGTAASICEKLLEAAELMKDRPSPVLRRLGEELRLLVTDAVPITASLVEAVVADTAPPGAWDKVIRGGWKAIDLLGDIIGEPGRPAAHRAAAFRLLPRVRGQRWRGGAVERLWLLGRQAPEVEVRIAALKCFTALRAAVPAGAAQDLQRDYENTTDPALRTAISEAFLGLFPGGTLLK